MTPYSPWPQVQCCPLAWSMHLALETELVLQHDQVKQAGAVWLMSEGHSEDSRGDRFLKVKTSHCNFSSVSNVVQG